MIPESQDAIDDVLAAAILGPLDDAAVEKRDLTDNLQTVLSSSAKSLDRFNTTCACLALVQQSLIAEKDAVAPVPPKPVLTDSSSLNTQSQTFGHFVLERELGRGGNGIVFLATDMRLKRKVAVKVPRQEVLMTVEQRSRFMREGLAAASLDHPQIIPVFEVGEIGFTCYITYPYCEGPTLVEWLEQQVDPVPCNVAARLVADLAMAVEYAHQKGVLHRDLSPKNILLESSSHADASSVDIATLALRITDFGLAKIQLDDIHHTVTGTILGTPQYMAPEQAGGDTQHVGPACDIHALGALLYLLLTGRPPYDAPSVFEVLRHIRDVEPIAPRRLRPSIPADLETICLKCLHKTPERRYLTAADVSNDLLSFIHGEPIQARPTGVPERVWKWIWRYPATAALVAVSTLAIYSIMAILFWVDQQQTSAKHDLVEARRHSKELANQVRQRQKIIRRQFYLAELREAQRHWESWKPELLSEVLERQRLAPGEEDLRGFEWYFHQHNLNSRGRVSFPAHDADVYFVAYAPDGQTFATASQDKTARIWNSKQRTLIHELRGHTNDVNWVSYSPDGLRIVTASDDQTARVWNAKTGTLLKILSGHEDLVLGALFLPDGKSIVTGTRKGVFHEWDAESFEPLGTDSQSTNHQRSNQLQWFGYSPNGQSLLSIHNYEFAWVNCPLQTPIFPMNDLSCAAFGHHSDNLAVLSKHAIRILDANTGAASITIDGHFGETLAFSPDDELLAVGNASGTGVELWQPSTGKRRGVLRTLPGRIWSLTFSPDGKTLAVGKEKGVVELWNTSAEAPYQPLYQDDEAAIVGLSMLRKGAFVVVARVNGSLQLFDTLTLELQATLTNPTPGVVAIAANDNNIAVARADGFVCLHDSRTLYRKQVLDSGGARLRSVGFSPDGRWLAAGTEDHEVLLWDVASLRLRAKLPGHQAQVCAIEFDPSSTRIASAGIDGVVRVWQLDSGKHQTLDLPLGLVTSLAYSHDGRRLAIGTSNSVRLFDFNANSCHTWPHNGQLRGISEVKPLNFGQFIASIGNREIAIIDSDKPDGLTQSLGNWGHITRIATSSSGDFIAVGYASGQLETWKRREDNCFEPIRVGNGRRILNATGPVVFIPDADDLLVAGRGLFAEIVNVTNGNHEALIEIPKDTHTRQAADIHSDSQISHLSIASGKSDDRVLCVTRYESGCVRLWELAKSSHRDGGRFRDWKMEKAAFGLFVEMSSHEQRRIIDFALSADGSRIATAIVDSTAAGYDRGSPVPLAEITIWDIASGIAIVTLPDHRSMAKRVPLAFSNDGRLLASQTNDVGIRVWDLSGRLVGSRPPGHQSALRDICFSPDRNLLALINDNGIRLWNCNTYSETDIVYSPTSPVHCGAFCPVGHSIAIGCGDGTVRLYSTIGQQELLTLHTPFRRVTHIAFSTDGTRLAVRGEHHGLDGSLAWMGNVVIFNAPREN